MPTDAMCMTMILLMKLPSYPTRRRTISLTPVPGILSVMGMLRQLTKGDSESAMLPCQAAAAL